MRTQRKFLALIMAVIMSLSIIPTTALADGETSGDCGSEGNNVTWKLEGSTLTISGRGDMADYAKPSDSTVGTTAPWWGVQEQIKKVVIEEGITHIGAVSFRKMTALEEIDIAASVETMGVNVASFCTALTSVNFDEDAKLTNIGEAAFWGTSLTEVTVPASVEVIEGGAFKAVGTLTEITFASGSRLAEIKGGNGAFSGTAITSIDLPEEVTVIGSYTFSDCKQLTSLTVPENVTELGDGICSGCTALTAVTLSDHIPSIGDWAFNGCSSLTEITVPASVRTIGKASFKNCTALTTVEFEDGSSLEEIGTSGNYEAFAGCTALKTINIPTSVEEIGQKAFKDCTALGAIDFSALENLTTIGSAAFESAASAVGTVIRFPSSLTDIGSGAFRQIPNIKVIDLSKVSAEINMGQSSFWEAENAVIYFPSEEVYQKVISANNMLRAGNARAITKGGTIAEDTALEDGKLADLSGEIGYIFSGWYDNAECSGEKYEAYAAGKTYYAKWEACNNHTYGEPVWNWNNDYSAATAAFTCTKCNLQTTKTAEVTSAETTAATCTENGVKTYTASVTIDDQTYTDSKTETIAAIGHTWNDGVVTTPATSTTDGVKTYTCIVCGETKTETIPATGSSPSPSPTPSKPSTSSRDDDDDGYAVSVPSSSSIKNGSITVSPRSAEKGDTVTITVKPDPGYELDELTVTAGGAAVKVTQKSDAKYTFTMPASRVSVAVSFVRTGAADTRVFADVPGGHWAEDEIAWAAENGYMNGNTATTFNPDGTVTRQQLWMILARLSGLRPADFAEAKDWAVQSGVTDGTNPGGAVTRQQLVTILYRWAKLMGRDVSGSADLTAYPDYASVASYAVDAMGWSVANGIVTGTAQGTLNPAGTATRAQFAVILYRFCEKTAG